MKKKVRLVTFDETLKEWLKDKEFRKGYEEELRKITIAHDLIKLRERKKLTQAALARRMRVSQPFIAKLESGQARNYNLETLAKLAFALDSNLEVRLKPHRARAA